MTCAVAGSGSRRLVRGRGARALTIAIALAACTATAGEPPPTEFQRILPTTVDDTTEADPGGNTIPFGAILGETYQYQQVYDASDFPSGNRLLISQIAFRPDGPTTIGGPTSEIVYDDFVVLLSTTAAGPNDIGVDLTGNAGADETVVFSGMLTLATAAQPSMSEPKGFDFVIDLDPLFDWNPAAGNLLLELRDQDEAVNAWSAGEVALDASDGFRNDSVGRAAQGDRDVADSVGLVTRFTYTLPEPSAHGLGVGAIAALLGLRRLASSRRRQPL